MDSFADLLGRSLLGRFDRNTQQVEKAVEYVFAEDVPIDLRDEFNKWRIMQTVLLGLRSGTHVFALQS